MSDKTITMQLPQIPDSTGFQVLAVKDPIVVHGARGGPHTVAKGECVRFVPRCRLIEERLVYEWMLD